MSRPDIKGFWDTGGWQTHILGIFRRVKLKISRRSGPGTCLLTRVGGRHSLKMWRYTWRGRDKWVIKLWKARVGHRYLLPASCLNQNTGILMFWFRHERICTVQYLCHKWQKDKEQGCKGSPLDPFRVDTAAFSRPIPQHGAAFVWKPSRRPSHDGTDLK